jgi:hypothetical protein
MVLRRLLPAQPRVPVLAPVRVAAVVGVAVVVEVEEVAMEAAHQVQAVAAVGARTVVAPHAARLVVVEAQVRGEETQ